MKIGELAKVSGISVSALRYYDSNGVLTPCYIDSFTGYRYYDESQIEVCRVIEKLKPAGFTLSEIKQIIQSGSSSEETERIFERKKLELNKILLCLDDIHKTIKEVNFMKKTNFTPLREDINLPFENDEQIIGKWEVLVSQEGQTSFGGKKRELVFLPGGEQYWCFSWTKGKLLFKNHEMSSINNYTTEQRGDGLYMMIQFKAYDYPETGRTELITLRQLDNKHYTLDEITVKDNTNLPFKDDERVLGKWYAFDFIKSKADFSPTVPTASAQNRKLFFSEVEFLPGGGCVSVYGDEVISGDNVQTWTKGYILRKFSETVCAYELRCVNNRDFLIVEWKSGDYKWGGCDTNYYVFTRENCKR